MKNLLTLLPFLLLLSCQSDAPLPEEAVTAPLFTDTIPFDTFAFRDSALLVPDFAGSPQAVFAVRTLLPRTDNEALNVLIQTTLGQDIAGENAPIQVTDLPQTLRIASREVLFNYRKQAVDTSDLVDNYSTYSLELSHDTEARLNTKGLLTLATMHYVYSGGAHGNYATSLHSFATDSTRLLAYEDVFLPGQEAELSKFLTAKAKIMQVPYQTDTVPATQNFAFTREGLLFNYPPYEIASYADGEIEIVLDYVEISHLLTGLAESLVLGMKASG